MSHSQKWGLHIGDPAPLNGQIGFPDRLNSLQQTRAVRGQWIIFPSMRSPSPLAGAQADPGLLGVGHVEQLGEVNALKVFSPLGQSWYLLCSYFISK